MQLIGQHKKPAPPSEESVVRPLNPHTPILSALELVYCNAIAFDKGWKAVDPQELREHILFIHSLTGTPNNFPITMWQEINPFTVRCGVDVYEDRLIIDIPKPFFESLYRIPEVE